MLLALLSGLFLFLAVGGLKTGAVFMWVAVVPLLILVYRAPTKRSAFWFSFAAGLIFFLAHISWVLSAAPLDWAGIENSVISYALVGIIWLLSSAVLGLFVGLFGFFLKYFPPRLWWFAAPGLLAVTEYGRAWGLGLWWLGKESSLGPNWTIGSLGYASANFSPLLNFSKMAGLYGMTFVVSLSSVLIFYLWLRFEKKGRDVPIKQLALGAAILVVFSAAVFLFRYYGTQEKAENQTKKVGLVQSNFLQQMQFSPLYFELRAGTNAKKIKELKAERPDIELIILPEGSLVTNFWNERTPEELKKIEAGGVPFTLIDAGRTNLSGPSPVRVLYIDSQNGLVAYKDKNFFIPGGEYLPYFVEALVRVFGQNEWLEAYNNARRPIVSPPPQKEFDGALREEGALICSGILAPDLYYKLASGNAGILINTASQSVFRGNRLFLNQSETMARFIAASSDRFLVQAANGGYNYIINNNGAIIAKSPGLDFGTLTGEAEYRHTKYPALWINKWLILGLAEVLLAVFAKSGARKTKS